MAARVTWADILRIAVPVVLLAALATVWRLSDLSGTVDRIPAVLESVREFPAAPLLVVGTLPLRLRDFVLGTAIGFVPFLAGLALLGESMREFLEDPTLGQMALMLGVAAALAGLALLAGRLLLGESPDAP